MRAYSPAVMRAHDALATLASVPFRDALTGEALRGVLESGEVPDAYWPHLHRALTEAPIEMIASVVFDTPAGPSRELLLTNLERVARAVDALPRIRRWLSG